MMTLKELTERVAEYAAAPQQSGRVRDVPDERTVRYYTTLGLIDRAADMRGRTALYTDRHLYQLLAIKKLQADGLSLEEIQARLVGLDDESLRALGHVEGPVRAPEKKDATTRRFWAQAPAVAPFETQHVLRLSSGVTLVIDGPTKARLNDDELMKAAETLVEYLKQHEEDEI